MRRAWMTALMIGIAALGGACGKGWRMDYGKPAAQFLQEDVASRGSAFVGQKITVKGTVTRIDVSDPKCAWIHLAEGIACNLGTFTAMADSCKPGDTVFIDGFLKRCEKGHVLLSPAMLRDPTAPFSPGTHRSPGEPAKDRPGDGARNGKAEAQQPMWRKLFARGLHVASETCALNAKQGARECGQTRTTL